MEARAAGWQLGGAGGDKPDIEDMFLPCWRGRVEHPTAVDVGARDGSFSSALVDSGFETWALEPDAPAFARLMRRFQGETRFHAQNLAASARRAILPPGTLQNGADAHGEPATHNGLRSARSRAVVAWPLAELARGRLVPRDIGLLRIDGETDAPDVLKGLGDLRPDVVMVGFSNRELALDSGGTAHDIDTYIALLEPLGYNWSITIFREPDTRKVGYSVARTQTPPHTRGSIAFFRSKSVHEATLEWCAGAVRSGQYGESGEEGVMLSELTGRYSLWRARLARTARLMKIAPPVIKKLAGFGPHRAYQFAREMVREEVDVVVTANEVSSSHGTGVLMTRILHGRSNIVAIRSQSHHNGKQDIDFKETFALAEPWMDRAEITEQVASWMRSYTARWILCVPYYESDLLIALALKAVSGAPMALYIMDDNCLETSGPARYDPFISREVMAEAIGRADACFAISPELRTAYEFHFHRKFWILPPLVASNLVSSRPSPVPEIAGSQRDGLLIGNIWGQSWLDRLEQMLREADWRLTWLASNTRPTWLNLPEAEDDPRIAIAPAPDTRTLIKTIRKAPFIVVPSGSPEDGGSHGAIAKYSLPTRIPFVVATAGTPLLVLGSEASAAARFVRRFDLGEVVPYSGQAFLDAVERLRSPARQTDIRQRSAGLASKFDVAGAYDYLESAVKQNGHIGQPRFEPLFPPLAGEFAVYQENTIPAYVYRDFVEIYRSMDRLAAQGYRPDFVIDAGASTGIWSYYLAEVFPKARFLLVDPLIDRYEAKWHKPGFMAEAVALADKAGRMTLHISGDLYNSSLLQVNSVATEKERVEVNVETIDRLMEKHDIAGRGVLKIDVQYAEHLVLAGAEKTLERVDFLVAELTLEPQHPDAKSITEMIVLIDRLGFRLFDDAGEWRTPGTGFLDQKDLVFVRKGWKLS
jgi:FkbM family methyltransferase